MTTQLQANSDRRSAELRERLADGLRQLREDAGLSRAAVARVAGVHPSVVSRMEDDLLLPTLETYGRICSALGADLSLRAYPNTGPPIHDRHQAPIAEVVLGSLDPRRWRPTPEVGVREPARGWVDLVLHDRRAPQLVASELESDIRRVEQLLRWSEAKAASLPSAKEWPSWAAEGAPAISRLLVVRWTRSNRDAVAAARRQFREAYPGDARDAIEALGNTTTPWPGSTLLWARIDGGHRELVPS